MTTFVLNTPCRAYRSWEATKEQTADLYHRILTSAGYSASSVEKYHYHSDCHRHIRSNLILITGVLAILKYKNYGVPAKVAIIRNKVLVNDLFHFQAKRLPFLLSGMNTFHHIFSFEPKIISYYENGKKAHPRGVCQSDKDTPLHSFHFQKIKKFVFLKAASCIYY